VGAGDGDRYHTRVQRVTANEHGRLSVNDEVYVGCGEYKAPSIDSRCSYQYQPQRTSETHRRGAGHLILRVNAAAAGKSRVVLHALFKRRKTRRVEHWPFKYLKLMISTQDDEIEKPQNHEREGRYRQWGGFEGYGEFYIASRSEKECSHLYNYCSPA
jgi:hypothetical protein